MACLKCGSTTPITSNSCTTCNPTCNAMGLVSTNIIDCNVVKCTDGCVETINDECVIITDTCFLPDCDCEASAFTLKKLVEVLCKKITALEQKVVCLQNLTGACTCSFLPNLITITPTTGNVELSVTPTGNVGTLTYVWSIALISGTTVSGVSLTQTDGVADVTFPATMTYAGVGITTGTHRYTITVAVTDTGIDSCMKTTSVDLYFNYTSSLFVSPITVTP